MRILVVEDELHLSEALSHILKKNNYTVDVANDGETGLDNALSGIYDVIVLDIMLPKTDGITVLKTLRSEGFDTPVILLTAKNEIPDKVLGLDSGADDYMVKPINVNEMVLRVGALLRRAQMINERRETIGDTVLEYDYLTVTTNGVKTVLPQKEFMLLYKMVSYPGRIFTRQQLMDDIWGYESDTDTHTLDVHIGRLRDRFRDNPDFKIITMRGVGYKVVKSEG